MSINDSIGNSTIGSTAPAEGTAEPGLSQGVGIDQEQPAKGSSAFATRANKSSSEGLSKGKLLLLGGGLAVAVLFFIITAIAGHAPKKQIAAKPQAQQQKQSRNEAGQRQRHACYGHCAYRRAGQFGRPTWPRRHPEDTRIDGSEGAPIEFRRNGEAGYGKATSRANAGERADVRADTTEVGRSCALRRSDKPAATQNQQQNALKEPSLVFVRSVTQSSAGTLSNTSAGGDATPRLDLTPGTRIEAKLETQISSAVLTPVVAVVEYTYAIGDRIVIPAGARVYGSLQQADRSGLVSVKFEEVELLDGAREKIEAVGTGLDLGPIKGSVYGKNTGKNFLIRAASGIGSVLAEVAGNNSSAAFSESDMLRERLAENIGTAGDTEMMSLNANSRVVVSVPADTKIYIVFTRHTENTAELHKVASAVQ